MKRKLRVCVVTGTRAEFGIWRPVLRAIEASRLLELKLVVTGMHLLEEFGGTVEAIEEEGFDIAERVRMYEPDFVPQPNVIITKRGFAGGELAQGISGLASAYARREPDVVMVLGDRLEMLAAASAALAERIPIAHVHGGETAPGIWDEQIRHALTKMAHVHFCATKTAGRRIVRMGENLERVHVVGAPALDEAGRFWEENWEMCMLGRHERGTRALLVLHPSGGDDQAEYQRTRTVLRVLKAAFPGAEGVTVVGPNNDPGHAGILRAYEDEARGMVFVMSMDQEGFWREMMECGLLVGNSSSGIIEAATLGVPVVNIGPRQAGRERSGNVIDVAWEPAAIEAALRRAVSDRAFLRRVETRKNVYGDGHASARIVTVLETFARGGGVPMEKQFCE
jgi:UDP-hydrolysing UDP-N-acetyl-D-glucosamine 2-epimerase